MSTPPIQNQIKLTGFKATRVKFTSTQKNENSELVNNFSLKLGDTIAEGNPNSFTKTFHLELVAVLSMEVLSVTVDFHTFFESNAKIESDFLNSDFAKISAPAIGFPFLRSLVSTISLQSGYPPIILPSVNFIQFAKDQAQQNR
ncbi:MAG: protein-export chaperone SecB [Bacteroidota bacterium]